MSAWAAAPSQPPPGFPDYVPTPKQERIVDRDGLVPYHRAPKPMRDEQGRVRVIIDFLDHVKDRYAESARMAIENFDPKRDRHNPLGLMLLDEKYRQYGIEPAYRRNERGVQERSEITTWVGVSMTAYLDERQIEALRRDPDVRLVTDDYEVRFASNGPPWNWSWNGLPWTERNDWGWHAVQGKSLIQTSDPVKVWIIDSGVAHHMDLPTVTYRASVGGANTVGCYAHGTHVAGIIGAAENNSQGRRGIYSGVDMRSIAVGDHAECSGNSTVSRWGQAFDLVHSLSFIYWPWSNERKVGVVNISANPVGTGFDGNVPRTNQYKLARLAGSERFYWWYNPGNFVVQSAGNHNFDACNDQNWNENGNWYPSTIAYIPNNNHPPSAVDNDGIMVVGAINSSGHKAVPFASTTNPLTFIAGTTNPVSMVDPGLGSNDGSCVDIWAPGDNIYSTWGMGAKNTAANIWYGNGVPPACDISPPNCTSPPHSGWAFLSGTSMAAPHVAAAAAYYIDSRNLTKAKDVEAAIRGESTFIFGRRFVRLQ